MARHSLRRRITAVLAVAALGAGTAVAAAPAASAHGKSSPTGTRSLAEVLGNDLVPGNGLDRNWRDFDIVREAADAVIATKGVDGTPVALLADGTVPLTAFIPDDRAFRVLVHDLTGRWLSEKKVFATLAALPIDTVEAVLLYHVVPGATISSKDVLRLYRAPVDDRTLTTAQGGTVEVKVWWPNRRFPVVELRDADRNDANPFLLRSALDVNAGNAQVAHGISRVLRPIDL
jgi:hypothetical protein